MSSPDIINHLHARSVRLFKDAIYLQPCYMNELRCDAVLDTDDRMYIRRWALSATGQVPIYYVRYLDTGKILNLFPNSDKVECSPLKYAFRFSPQE